MDGQAVGALVAGRGTDGPVSFAAFVGSRQHDLLRCAYLMTGDQHRAEDLLQGALTKLAARWEAIRDTNPEGFVRTVIYRDSISWWRKHRRERLSPSTPDRGTPDSSADVDSRLLLRSALARLTPKQRAVVVLRFYEDLGEAQVADLLGVSVGTVKSQTHAALGRLREDFAQQDLFDTARDAT